MATRVIGTNTGDSGKSPDPTFNVMALVEASITRIDDLRDAETVRVNEALAAITVAYLHALESTSKRLDEKMELRANYTEKLVDAEAKRIDAIRVVDVQAVSVANEKATAQALVLANQVSTSADTLRELVATTATVTATQLQQLTTQLTERIAQLEKAQYEGQGKAVVRDPLLAELIAEMKINRDHQAMGTGVNRGIGLSWGVVIGAVGFISTIVSIFVILSKFVT